MVENTAGSPAPGSVRLQVRFSADELRQLKLKSASEGGTLSATVRALALRSLAEQSADTATYALAAVVAAEHTLRLLQTIVPEGASRSAHVAAEAWTAALERVSLARAELGEESGR